mmetsp:Transcript_19285/g.53795  ORF Transcript_19285/g.53795 Transcript_19285/m.53795 type:complete len:295 (+) Transcript_19285:181-1065(+)
MKNYADPCSAVAPFMRAMECIPEEDDANAGHASSSSLFSTFRGLKPGSNQSDSSDSNTLLQTLKTRLESFLSCGWLTKEEYQQHVEFLSTYKNKSSIGANGKFALKELEKELDSIEETKSKEPTPQSWSDMFMSTLGVSTSKKSNGSSFWSSSKSSSTSPSSAPLATATNRVVNGSSAPTIVSPKDLSNILSEDAISELFVETCFFARLGFVQPPCCMSCTYKEALKGNIPDLKCPKWVVWRQNANKIFDPSNNADMSENAILIQCQSARKLIAGKMVEHYQWDDRGKMLRKKG